MPGVQEKHQKTRVLGPKSQTSRDSQSGCKTYKHAGNAMSKGSSIIYQSHLSIHSTASKKQKGNRAVRSYSEQSWKEGLCWGWLPPGTDTEQQTFSFACAIKLPSWAGMPGLGRADSTKCVKHISLGLEWPPTLDGLKLRAEAKTELYDQTHLLFPF